MINDEMAVSWRIDDAPATRGRWSISSDNKAAGLWSGGEAIPFLKSLAGKQTLRIRLSGRSNEYNVEYPLATLRPHIEKIAAACGWRP